jgi:rod shape-determining protein MreD
MRDVLFGLLTGVVCLLLQTGSFGLHAPMGFKPDLLLIVTAWAAVRLNFTSGIFFSFLAGAATDLFSGSPTGLFAIVYCLVFVYCGYFQEILRIDGNLPRAVLVFTAALGAGLISVLARWVEGPVGFGWVAGGWILFRALVTGAASLVVFPLLDWSRAGFDRVGVR